MDWQHLIMNGESLAEYAALLAAEGLLGHLHANDGWGTFDDDNMVGTIRFMETIELAVELRRAGYGDNGERLGFDLYPYTEDAVGAVKRSVLQWRFIDGIASRIDERSCVRRSTRRTRCGPTSSSTPRWARMRLQHVSVAIARTGPTQARAFYGGLLGLEEKPVPPKLDPNELVWFSVGGDLELHLMQTATTPPPSAHFCLAVDTGLDELRARIEAAGIETRDADGDRRPAALHVPRPVREPRRADRASRGVTAPRRDRRRHERRQGGRPHARRRDRRRAPSGVPALDAAARAGPSRIPRTGGAPTEAALVRPRRRAGVDRLLRADARSRRLDEGDQVIRPAILWNDQRTAASAPRSRSASGSSG